MKNEAQMVLHKIRAEKFEYHVALCFAEERCLKKESKWDGDLVTIVFADNSKLVFNGLMCFCEIGA